jgi:hypothetical protein
MAKKLKLYNKKITEIYIKERLRTYKKRLRTYNKYI